MTSESEPPIDEDNGGKYSIIIDNLLARIDSMLGGKLSEIHDPLDTEVENLLIARRSEAEELIKQGLSVSEIVCRIDNDYSILEESYRKKVGNDLLSTPENSPEKEIVITKKCSIVIPTYNNFVRLQNCLNSIHESSFFKKYPQLLEVVVVDDGSPAENISERVREMDLGGLDVKVFRQSNGRAGKARYSGVLNCTGDIVLFTDPDIVYTPNTIEEYMKRHQVLEGVAFFGLRDQIDSDDSRLKKENIDSGSLDSLPNDIKMDTRVAGISSERSAWLKKSGNDVRLPIDEDSDVYIWRLKNIAWSLSISADRRDLLRIMAGYDERYVGYGGEDDDMTSRLIALGTFIIPMTGGFCYHQRHDSVNDEAKRAVNIRILNDNLSSPLKQQDINNPQQTDAMLEFSSRN